MTPHAAGQHFTTIQSLPNELLEEIFLHYAHSAIPSSFYSQCRDNDNRLAVLCLQHVCLRWRHIVQSSALLWTNITLAVGQSEHISSALRNSRQAKLDVNAQVLTSEETFQYHFGTGDVDEEKAAIVGKRLLDVLQTCADRIRTLSVDECVQEDVDRRLWESREEIGAASALEVLVLNGELSADSVWFFIIFTARNIKDLCLNTIRGIETWALPSLPQLHSLRKLQLGDLLETLPSLSAILSFVRNFPALEHLLVAGSDGDELEEIQLGVAECEPVSLRRLRHLEIYLTCDDVVSLTLLSGLILPLGCKIVCPGGDTFESTSAPPLPPALLTSTGTSIAGTYKEVDQLELNIDQDSVAGACSASVLIYPKTDLGERKRTGPSTIPMPLRTEATGLYCAALRLGSASLLRVNRDTTRAHVRTRHGECMPSGSLCAFCETLGDVEELDLGCCVCTDYGVFLASFIWCPTAGAAHFRSLKRVVLSYRPRRCEGYDGEPVRDQSEEGFNHSIVDAVTQRQASLYPIERLTIRVQQETEVDSQVLVERLRGIVEVVVDMYVVEN